MKEEISDYITFAHKQGKSDEEIGSYLETKGWSSQDIQQGYSRAKSLEVESLEKPKISRMRVLVLEVIIVFVIITTITIFVLFRVAYSRIFS